MTREELLRRIAPKLFITDGRSDRLGSDTSFVGHITEDHAFIKELVGAFNGRHYAEEERYGLHGGRPAWALVGRPEVEPFLREVLPFLPPYKAGLARMWLDQWALDDTYKAAA